MSRTSRQDPTHDIAAPASADRGSHEAEGDDILVRLFVEEDSDAVFSLYGQVFGEAALALFKRRWQWQFALNPSVRYAPSLIWLAEKEGEILGHLAAFPQRMKLLDQQTVVYHDCDLIVSPKARRLGIGRRLVEAYDACPGLLSSCLSYAAANGRIRQRQGYQPANAIPRYFRPCDVSALLSLLLRSGRLPGILTKPPFSWLARVLAGGANLAVGIANTLKKPRPSGKYVVTEVATIDAEFDDLWRSLSSQFPLLAVRDAAFVQWRFADDPIFENTILAARDRHGQLVGYVVMRIWDRNGVMDARVVDLFCPPDSKDIIDSLLLAAFEFAEERGADLISCWGLHPSLRKQVKRRIYVAPSNLNRPSWFLWKGREELRRSVYSADNWHLSCADSDIGFSA